MEQKTNFFSVIPYSNFLHGAKKKLKIDADYTILFNPNLNYFT